jgi:gliding motility-associated-like protein
MSIHKTKLMPFKKITLFAIACMLSAQAIAQCNAVFTVSAPVPVCSGRDFQLTATDFPGGVYTWTGPPGSGFGGVLPYNPTVTNPQVLTHSGNYSVTVNLPGGCIYNAVVNVSVESTPPKPVVTASKDPLCPGEDLTLTATSGSPIGSTYVWTGPGWPGFSSTIVNTATIFGVQPANSGTYTVYVESTAGCKSDLGTKDIMVYPEVIAGFTNQLFYGCIDDSVQFQNTSIGGWYYDWDFGDGTGSSLPNPLHTYINQGGFIIRLIASNQFCKDTTFQNVNIKHEINAGFTVDDDSICQHNTINFTNTTTYDPVVLPVYAWDFKDGGTDNVINPSHLFDFEGIYTVRMIATDYLGCKDTAEHVVVVDSTGSISFEVTEEEVCAGTTIGLKGTFMQQGNTGSSWNMADGNILKDKFDFNYTFDAPGTYEVKFIANYRVCPDAEFSKLVTVKPYPKVNLGEDTSLCLNGKAITLTETVNAGNPNAVYTWNSDGTAKAPSIQVRHSGMYATTVEIDGCSASDSVYVSNNCYINIPNAFSPNGDGNGDYFLPRQALSKGVSKFNMNIYNRWGQLLFTSNSINGRGWDGKYNNQPQDLGVYVYLVDVTFVDGTRESYEGNVTLLR